jgi:GH25 family lysozyme M1 (1,4-beta-N-acetylmuramidase)
MSQFKVGDWVRNNYLNRIFKYSHLDLKYDNENPYQNKNDELWVPKRNEYVWSKTFGVQKVHQFIKRGVDNGFIKRVDGEYIVNPFIIIPFGTNEDLAYNAQKEWESWE